MIPCLLQKSREPVPVLLGPLRTRDPDGRPRAASLTWGAVDARSVSERSRRHRKGTRLGLAEGSRRRPAGAAASGRHHSYRTIVVRHRPSQRCGRTSAPAFCQRRTRDYFGNCRQTCRLPWLGVIARSRGVPLPADGCIVGSSGLSKPSNGVWEKTRRRITAIRATRTSHRPAPETRRNVLRVHPFRSASGHRPCSAWSPRRRPGAATCPACPGRFRFRKASTSSGSRPRRSVWDWNSRYVRRAAQNAAVPTGERSHDVSNRDT
jgi:hypothetical protein